MTSTIAFFRVAALCLLASAAHASTVPAAQADAPVPATRHQPTAYRAPAAQDATPDRAWRDQNRIVAGYNSMMLTMAGEQHAQHAAPQAAADPHAGHKMQAAAAADPHAGHKMQAAAADPHAGHHMHKTVAQAGEAAPLLAAARAAGQSKTGCACCKKDGAQGAGSCMAPPAGKPEAGHGAGAAQGGCACCKGKDASAAGHGAHAGMAMAASSPAQCMAGAGKGGGCCKDGCCKDGCCKDGACAMAAAPAGTPHEGHH